MEEAGDLLEDSWFFGNLLDTKTRSISRCYSDLTSTSCPPPRIHRPLPPLCSNQERIVKNERKNPSRKQPPVPPPCLTRTPSLPFLMKNKNSGSNSSFMVGSDQEDAVERKQSTIATPNAIETQSFLPKTPNPSPNLTRTSSMSTSVDESDQEDEEEDQESEFSLGRLIRQASMNSRQTSKAIMNENLRKKQELYQEKISDMRNRSKNTRISGKKKNGGGTSAPAIPGGWVDKSSSDDMKAHIKFWARAVASNVRQDCS